MEDMKTIKPKTTPEPTGVPGNYHEYPGNASMSKENPYKGNAPLGGKADKPAQ